MSRAPREYLVRNYTRDFKHETTSLKRAAIRAMVKALTKEAFPLTQVHKLIYASIPLTQSPALDS